MNHARSVELGDRRPASARRREAQRRLDAQRAAVRHAWGDFVGASLQAQARVHRVVDWARTLSALAGVVGAIVAVRQMAMRGGPRPAVRTMAIIGLLRRLLPTAYHLYPRRT